MNDQILDLLSRRMDDHRDEANRRFDALALDIHEVKTEVKSISSWRWKIAGGIIVSGFGISLVFKLCEHVLEYYIMRSP
jgi:hypothetical protein